MEEMKDIVLKYVIAEYVEDDSEIKYDTPLISGGIVDSFSMVSLNHSLKTNTTSPSRMTRPHPKRSIR